MAGSSVSESLLGEMFSMMERAGVMKWRNWIWYRIVFRRMKLMLRIMDASARTVFFLILCVIDIRYSFVRYPCCYGNWRCVVYLWYYLLPYVWYHGILTEAYHVWHFVWLLSPAEPLPVICMSVILNYHYTSLVTYSSLLCVLVLLLLLSPTAWLLMLLFFLMSLLISL